jgi:hypothetical protein
VVELHAHGHQGPPYWCFHEKAPVSIRDTHALKVMRSEA